MASVQILEQNRRSLTVGLLWGGAMLAILTYWTAAAHDDTPSAVIGLLSLLAAAAIILSGVAFFSKAKADDAQRSAILDRRRRLLGVLLLASAALLLVMAIWLGVWYGLSAFGEAVGLGILALIAAGAGWHQLAFVGTEVDRDKIFASVAERGVIAVLVRPFAGGQPSAQAARNVILFLGGFVGLTLTMIAVLWAWAWRNDVFLAGLAAWRGEQSWKLWLCTYLGLLGLAVMFGTLALTRTDIRADPVFRRVLYGYNTIFVGFLLLAFLVVLNILVYVLYPMTTHWSESRGFYTLSESAKDILQKLKEPTKLYVMLSYPPLEKDMRSLLDNARAVTDKLEVEYFSPEDKLERLRVLGERYPEILTMVRELERGLGLGVLVVYGAEPKAVDAEQPPHVMIPVSTIADLRSNPETRSQSYTFKGEEALISQLNFLAAGKQKLKVYFLHGNGELSLGEAEAIARPATLPLKYLSMSVFFDRLKKEGYEARGLSFAPGKSTDQVEHVQASGKGTKKDVPDDASVVVVAGASEPIPKETLDALDRYIKDRKGRMLILSDVVLSSDKTNRYQDLVNTGLESWLKHQGVDVTDTYLHRLPPFAETRTGGLIALNNPIRSVASVALNDTTLASKFVGQKLSLETVRVITPATEKAGQFSAKTVLQVVPEENENGAIWAEDDYRGLRNVLQHSIDAARSGRLEAIASDKPLSVGVTVAETNGTPRMVVIGDAELASDREITGRNGTANFNFLTSAIDWLADRPGIGIRPKDAGIYRYPSDVSPARMALLPAWLMMLCVIGLGVGIWVVRRR